MRRAKASASCDFFVQHPVPVGAQQRGQALLQIFGYVGGGSGCSNAGTEFSFSDWRHACVLPAAWHITPAAGAWGIAARVITDTPTR